MQQLRYLCITAHEDGSVNYAEVGWGKDGEKGPLVLPLPLYLDVAIGAALECFVALGGRYWVESWAALCEVGPLDAATFEGLWLAVMERNERWRYNHGTRELPFDAERF